MFAVDTSLFEHSLQKIHTLCIANSWTLGSAESCTGGLLSACLTHLAGSSAYFKAGVCTYANSAKFQMLGVPEALIAKEGAVSAQVAQHMAQGLRSKAQVDFAVAVTGVAGPGGGTPQKPIGTVFCAWATAAGVEVQKLHLQGNREEIRAQTCYVALEGLLARLQSSH